MWGWLVQEIVISGEDTEVGLSGNSSTAKALAVTGLLDIAQCAGDASVAVCVERIEGQGYACVAARVHFGAVEDRGDALIDDLRSGQLALRK